MVRSKQCVHGFAHPVAIRIEDLVGGTGRRGLEEVVESSVWDQAVRLYHANIRVGLLESLDLVLQEVVSDTLHGKQAQLRHMLLHFFARHRFCWWHIAAPRLRLRLVDVSHELLELLHGSNERRRVDFTVRDGGGQLRRDHHVLQELPQAEACMLPVGKLVVQLLGGFLQIPDVAGKAAQIGLESQQQLLQQRQNSVAILKLLLQGSNVRGLAAVERDAFPLQDGKLVFHLPAVRCQIQAPVGERLLQRRVFEEHPQIVAELFFVAQLSSRRGPAALLHHDLARSGDVVRQLRTRQGTSRESILHIDAGRFVGELERRQE
mmetsp:Transcript_12398/g.36018  ORF Transcript_12398/g.36018 Transcript_12398/m.36018 type:complete len:320 (+) Transcript_12398:1701-2660(+)